MAPRSDETWHRLSEWTNSHAQSERLAGQILLSEGFADFDPSHPLGGPDGGKDALATHHGLRWLMAAYFPRGKRPFTQTRNKFAADFEGVARNRVEAFVFVTNQELTLSERAELRAFSDSVTIELYHLERIVALLDQPSMRAVRDQYLGNFDVVAAVNAAVDEAERRLVAVQTGGDTFCDWMLYHFDLTLSIARNFVVIRVGDFPLYDVRIRICDLDAGKDVLEESWGELNSPADYKLVRWRLPDDIYYRAFFHARNGSWHQDLHLRRSDAAQCWLAATRVIDRTGRTEVLRHVDGEYNDNFGEPTWR